MINLKKHTKADLLFWMTVVFALAAVAGLMAIVDKPTEEPEAVWEGECFASTELSVAEDDRGHEAVNLAMNCNGTPTSTFNPHVIAAWSKNPGPIHCVLYSDDSVACLPRESA